MQLDGIHSRQLGRDRMAVCEITRDVRDCMKFIKGEKLVRKGEQHLVVVSNTESCWPSLFKVLVRANSNEHIVCLNESECSHVI